MFGKLIVEAAPEEAVDVESRVARRSCMCRAAALREDSKCGEGFKDDGCTFEGAGCRGGIGEEMCSHRP